MQLIPETRPSQVISFQWLYTCVMPKCVIHSTRMDSRDLGFSLLITGVWSGIHLSWPSSVVRVPMSNLSILSSGTLVHPGDRCLTTLWLLGACASRDTGPCRSWDLAYVAPILPMVNDARGLVGTICNQKISCTMILRREWEHKVDVS